MKKKVSPLFKKYKNITYIRVLVEKLFQIVYIRNRDDHMFLILLATALFVDIFFIPRSTDLVIFGILGIYAYIAHIRRLQSSSTFIVALGVLITVIISYITSGASTVTEKGSVWLILFMALGIFQQWRE